MNLFNNNNNRPAFQNNTQNPPANNLFNNNQGNNPMSQNQGGQPNFMNNNNNNTPQFNNNMGGNNMFNNNNTGANNMTGNNMFNNNNTNTNTGNNMFNNNNNMFNNNSTQNTNNLFNNNNNNNNNNNMFNNSTGSNQNYNQNQNFNYNQRGLDYSSLIKQGNTQSLLDFQQRIQRVKNHLEECSRRMANRNLQSLSLNQYNLYIDKPLNQVGFKNQVVQITKYFHELNAKLTSLKKTNEQIQKKMQTFSKDTHEKLNVYKKCLLQTVSHEKLIKQVTSQLEMMNKQVEQYFNPLFNAYKSRKKISIKQPNQFDLKVSYDILNRLEILNQRVDDIIACENPPTEQEIQNTTNVFDQLIQYYQNVSCSFYQFCTKYNTLKRQAINEKRLNYQDTMSKVMTKVQENLKSQFKYYDLIRQINELLATKDKRKESEAQYDVGKRRY